MGMSIDEAIHHLNTWSTTHGSGQTTDKQHEEAKKMAIDTMRKYQMFQADYVNRLKADLEAILVELQLDVEEMDSGCGWEGYRPTAQVIGLIQQKINELKAESEDQDD